jgi:hypothetical protein
MVVGGGTYSGIVYSNTASGESSIVAGGTNNSASGLVSAVIGSVSASATGTSCVALGTDSSTASGGWATVIGGAAGSTRAIFGNTVLPASRSPISGLVGATQTALLVLGKQTTDATATVLTSEGTAASTTNQVILPNNSAYYFKGSVIANVTGAANGASWSFEGAIMRGANAASTVLIGTPAINRVAATAGASLWVVALTADTTNGGLAVTVTGLASTTIRWVAKVETTEVTF